LDEEEFSLIVGSSTFPAGRCGKDKTSEVISNLLQIICRDDNSSIMIAALSHRAQDLPQAPDDEKAKDKALDV
jgi:hypothetical protein